MTAPIALTDAELWASAVAEQGLDLIGWQKKPALVFERPGDLGLWFRSVKVSPVVPAGYVLAPWEPTQAILKAMAESRARDDEGEFPAMLDLLDFSGENKMRTVLSAAYKAAIAAIPACSAPAKAYPERVAEQLRTWRAEVARLQNLIQYAEAGVYPDQTKTD